MSGVDGWFPHIRADQYVVSGSSGIWLTPPGAAPVLYSATGGRPIFTGPATIVHQNGSTTKVGSCTYPVGYNELVGSDDGQWAGMIQDAVGAVHHWVGPNLVATIAQATMPGFLGSQLGYLTPYQAQQRQLVIGGAAVPLHVADQPVAAAAITAWAGDRAGIFYVYSVATGTYSRLITDHTGRDCTIRPQHDETPYLVFTGPDGYPWILSWTPDAGAFVRMIYSAGGYQITGLLYNPDARMTDGKLRIVASAAAGAPREAWIDFSAPKIDLRTL